MNGARSLRGIGVGLLTGVLLAAPHPARAQQSTSSCGADSDMQAQVLGVTQDILADTSSRNVELLASVGLSNMPPDSSSLVTDSHICARAAQRMNWLAGEHRKDRPVYVVRVGQIWAVHDPTFHAGEYSPLVLFDSHWKLLKILLAM